MMNTNPDWDMGATAVEEASLEGVFAESKVKGIPRSKIPTRKVPSDDCFLYPDKERETLPDGTVTIKDQGEGIPIHEGEYIEFLPVVSMFQYLELGKISDPNTELDEKDKALDTLCVMLSKRLVSWDWTDLWSEPYQQPFRNPAAIRSLEDDELIYIINLLQRGASESQLKND